MDASFWLGALIGVAATGAGWFVPTRLLVPRLEVTGWERFTDADGRIRYRFRLSNRGWRDAVDVAISCTLFSRGWGATPDDQYATITIPVSVSRIDVIPHAPDPLGSAADRRIDALGARLITMYTDELTEFQLKKLTKDYREKVTAGRATLKELFALGKPGHDGKPDSFLNVVVYGVDSYSGARSVIKEQPLEYDEIPQ